MPGAPRALDRTEFEGLRVLLAEDNDLNAEIACELLAEAGLVVERAGDGAEACVMFEASKIGYFDAVLMDVQMPATRPRGASASSIAKMRMPCPSSRCRPTPSPKT